MGKKKSEAEEPMPEWLKGIDSETPERRLAFLSWLQRSGSVDDEDKEMIERALFPRGEHKKVH